MTQKKTTKKVVKTTKKETIYLGPSSAERWLHCPGSAFVENKRNPFEEKKEADEGINKHSLAAAALMKDGSAEVEDPEVAFYVDECRRLMEKCDNGFQIHIEKPLKYLRKGLTVSGVPDLAITGQYPDGRKVLFIIDAKFGYVEVPSENNQQLKLYAHLFCDNNLSVHDSNGPDVVIGVIIQPALRTVDPWPIQIEPDFLSSVVDYMIKNKKCLNVGPHCVRCNSNDICKTFLKVVKDFMHPKFHDINPSRGKIWTDMLAIAKPAEKMFKKVQQQARLMMETGIEIKGFGITTRAGDRTLTKDVDSKKLAKLYKVPEEKVFHKKMLSVAQLEKTFGTTEPIRGLYYQPPIKMLKAIPTVIDPKKELKKK